MNIKETVERNKALRATAQELRGENAILRVRAMGTTLQNRLLLREINRTLKKKF